MKAFDDHRGAGVEMTREEFSALYRLATAARQTFEGVDEEIAQLNAEQLAELVKTMRGVIMSY